MGRNPVLTRLIITVVAALAVAGVYAPAAYASHRCSGAYGIPATVSDSVSCPFAKNVVRTWVNENRGSYLRTTVYSPVSHKTYTVTYRFNRGTVQAWANGKDSWIRFWYAN
jgi:hypothetical protein